MSEQLFVFLCKQEVIEYVKLRFDEQLNEDQIYVAWLCQILPNRKVLISTTLLDGMYYEITYNGVSQEFYVDAYKKVDNYVKCVS